MSSIFTQPTNRHVHCRTRHQSNLPTTMATVSEVVVSTGHPWPTYGSQVIEQFKFAIGQGNSLLPFEPRGIWKNVEVTSKTISVSAPFSSWGSCKLRWRPTTTEEAFALAIPDLREGLRLPVNPHRFQSPDLIKIHHPWRMGQWSALVLQCPRTLTNYQSLVASDLEYVSFRTRSL